MSPHDRSTTLYTVSISHVHQSLMSIRSRTNTSILDYSMKLPHFTLIKNLLIPAFQHGENVLFSMTEKKTANLYAIKLGETITISIIIIIIYKIDDISNWAREATRACPSKLKSTSGKQRLLAGKQDMLGQATMGSG